VAGPAGATGLQGIQGQVGAPGPIGVAGPSGIQGPAGAQGLTGPNGATGSTGPQGLPGTAGEAGAQGIPGPSGSTGLQGPGGPQGVQGLAGATGATGAQGAVGMNFRGAWNHAIYYAVNDAVTFAGSTYLAQSSGSGAEPDLYPQQWDVVAQAGDSGPSGATGSAASVSVGTVDTLAAGSVATVTNSGTAEAAVFNFGIPQGAAGAPGSGGGSGTGTASGSFAAMYHAVSYSTLYYATNSPNASATEASGAVLAWVPQGCTASRLDVYSQQSGAVTVTLRAGPPGSIVDTVLVCSAATNGSCSATGSVLIAAGDLIDFRFDGASGTIGGIWTALQCQ
jgi:collagen type VII alpha